MHAHVCGTSVLANGEPHSWDVDAVSLDVVTVRFESVLAEL